MAGLTQTSDMSHSSCVKDEPCVLGQPETCPAARAASARLAALSGSWSVLTIKGDRHFLDGEPIHCGTALELQAIEFRNDDYGEYHAVLQRGIRVRYELNGPGSLAQRVVLHVTVDGHEFTSRLWGSMRFRWPAHTRR